MEANTNSIDEAKDVGATVADRETLQGWQPIETAPTRPLSDGFASESGPRFLGYPVRGMVAGVRWSETRSRSMAGGVVGVFISDWNMQCKPTHWMPLPNPPTERREVDNA